MSPVGWAEGGGAVPRVPVPSGLDADGAGEDGAGPPSPEVQAVPDSRTPTVTAAAIMRRRRFTR
jgi:hypothetical protein